MSDEIRFAPYCPPATLLSVLRHFRRRDVPTRISKPDALIQIGVSEGLVNRTWQAMTFLDLIDDEGNTRENLRTLRYANDDEYPKVLEGILRSAYSNIFDVINPATASEGQFNNAFHPYSPLGQRSRMVTLFIGLCNAAGIETSVKRNERSTQAEGSAGGSRAPRAAGATPRQPVRRNAPPPRRSSVPSGEDAALVAWFNTRPEAGSVWSPTARAKWNTTLMAIIAGLYEETAPVGLNEDADDDAEAQGQ